MKISEIIQETINKFPDNYVFGAKDFNLGPQERQAVNKALQRLAKSGTIKVLSKGKYYKPRVTLFGTLRPTPAQIAREFMVKDGETIGYLTGASVFSDYSLSTQISSKIQIGTNTYRQPITREGNTISFVLQTNAITDDNIELLPILDCMRLIKQIPATTTEEACKRLICIVESLPAEKRELLVDNAMGYNQSVRALCGAILEQIGSEKALTGRLRETISSASKSLYEISEATLPTKYNWRIYEPARK